MSPSFAAMTLLAVLLAVGAGTLDAQAADGRVELALMAKRLAEIDVYSVRVSVRVSAAGEDGGVARAMRVEAWRERERFAYRSGAVEILWAQRAVVVVNHSSRTVVLREPVRQPDAPAELAAALSFERLTGGGTVEHVDLRQDGAARRFVIRYAAGPLLRTEIESDLATALPSTALLVYRPAARAAGAVAIAYEWSTSPPPPDRLDDARFLAWEGEAVSLQPRFKHYRLVRLDRKP